jgi:hypothetical protein
LAANMPLAMLNARQLTVRGSLVGNPHEFKELVDHVQAGRIRPIPIRSESIEKVKEGLAALRAGQIQGRIVQLHAPTLLDGRSRHKSRYCGRAIASTHRRAGHLRVWR